MVLPRRIMRHIFLLAFLALTYSSARAQDPVPASITLKVAAFGSVRTEVLDVTRSDVVRVQPLAGPAGTPSVDTYVYGEDKQLVAKDDDETLAPAFEWSPPQTGRYYILIHNGTEIPGTVEVRIERTRRGDSTPFPSHVIQRIFFATDREHRKGSPPVELFGPEPAKLRTLTYGMSYISIPRNHRMGELEGPSIFRLEFRPDPKKHVVLERVVPVARQEFLRRLGDRVKTSERHEALVFVHGFSTTFEEAARRTAQIAHDLAFAGAAILFSWPSQGSVSLIDYNKDGRNSTLSVDSLEQFLRELATEAGVSSVHVIAHSMGNRVLTGALQKLVADPGARSLKVKQVALMAPDIDADLFRTMAGAIASSAERVTLYASSKDKALAISRRLVGGYPRAGEAGPGIIVMNGLDTVDVTSVGTDILGHGYFADNTSVLADLYHVLRNAPPKDRFGLRPQTQSNRVYWIYQPAGR